MNSTLPLRSSNIPITRTGWLAAASAVVAVASVSVTLAVTSGGGDDATATPASAGATPSVARPDPAKLYSHSVPRQSQPIGAENGRGAAERFHHFR